MVDVPVRRHDQVVIEITGMGHAGEGVGRYQGFTVFVPGGVPGDEARVQITEVKKNYARGRLLEIVQPAAIRQEPRCELYEPCGGCQLQHITYEAQLEQKTALVRNALTRIGKLQDIVVRPAIGAADPWFYRNKAQFPVGMSDGKIVAGCYAPKSHAIIDTPCCYIQHNLSNEVMQAAKELLGKYRISVYDEAAHRGLVRHILVRVGVTTGEAMAVLVTNGEHIPHAEAFARELMARVPGLVSVVQNINTRRTNVILGEVTRTIAGKDAIEDYLSDLKFKISAKSFFQVNPLQTKVLYDQALQYAGLSGNETVIDAYCGIGTISLFCARRAKKVYGVEVVEEAIEDAKENAKLNGIENVEFICGEAEVVMPQLQRQGVTADVIIVDPPRKGCENIVLDTFVRMQPERIVYVSCNPTTLARDLAYLDERGYQAVEVQPVDMFPQTSHVECVTLMSKVEK